MHYCPLSKWTSLFSHGSTQSALPTRTPDRALPGYALVALHGEDLGKLPLVGVWNKGRGFTGVYPSLAHADQRGHCMDVPMQLWERKLWAHARPARVPHKLAQLDPGWACLSIIGSQRGLAKDGPVSLWPRKTVWTVALATLELEACPH